MRLSVGILFVVLASNTGTLAMAQENEPPAVASFHQADLLAPRVFVSNPPGEYPTAPAPDQQRFTALSITESQEDGFDGCCSPTWSDPCPCFYVQVGALLMQQVPRFSNQPIIVDPNTGTTFLSTSDFNSNFNPGFQATVGMRLCGGRAVEFDYFGLFGGNATATAVRPDPSAFLTFPNNLAGNVFVDMDRADVNYSSSVQSFALNWLCCCGCCDESCCGEVSCQSFTWFAGFRYLNLNERFNISAQRTVAGTVEEGTYNISTNNNLYGAQLGARLRRTRGRLGWEGTGFAGIFGNDASQTQQVTDFPSFPLRPTVSSSRGGVAFVGGANLSGLYNLTNVWNLKAGYNVIWIESVALAPDQLDFNFAASPSGNQLHNGGGMFLHGVNVGLEGRW